MNIKHYKADVWETGDGKKFFSRLDAALHQKVLDFDFGYNSGIEKLYGNTFGDVPAEDLRKWIITNKDLVRSLLGV